jgi:Prokaryotic cytochrome b561
MGTRYARFGSLVRGPRTVVRYLRSMLAGQPVHYIGHNPAGALAIVLMLLLGLAIVATGYAVYNGIGGDRLGELHEGAANAMLVVVAVHVAGVALASYIHHENLPRAMVTGTKRGPQSAGIARAWWTVAVLMLLAVAAYWYWQWREAPHMAAQMEGGSPAQSGRALLPGYPCLACQPPNSPSKLPAASLAKPCCCPWVSLA